MPGAPLLQNGHPPVMTRTKSAHKRVKYKDKLKHKKTETEEDGIYAGLVIKTPPPTDLLDVLRAKHDCYPAVRLFFDLMNEKQYDKVLLLLYLHLLRTCLTCYGPNMTATPLSDSSSTWWTRSSTIRYCYWYISASYEPVGCARAKQDCYPAVRPSFDLMNEKQYDKVILL